MCVHPSNFELIPVVTQKLGHLHAVENKCYQAREQVILYNLNDHQREI
jgi:hypothetical protein